MSGPLDLGTRDTPRRGRVSSDDLGVQDWEDICRGAQATELRLAAGLGFLVGVITAILLAWVL